MPFDTWNSHALGLEIWRLILAAIAILALRRLPALILLHKLIPDVKTFREALFVGHFGPMGVGAIFIGTLAQQRLPTPNSPPETGLDYLSYSIQPVVYFVVLSSILVSYSLASSFVLRLYLNLHTTNTPDAWPDDPVFQPG
jgi:NhaP-type Na+/H+ or K+/H+ antiporter